MNKRTGIPSHDLTPAQCWEQCFGADAKPVDFATFGGVSETLVAAAARRRLGDLSALDTESIVSGAVRFAKETARRAAG